jgi:predicted transcriptional regulator
MTGENIEPPGSAVPSPAVASSGAKRRHSLLELAPLELDCMNALWILGPATVRDVRDRIAPQRPRAYTTIMTILDRLARKGAVQRSKVGRAYLYRANLSAEEARTHAVGQVIENFFGGSPEALLSQLHRSGVRTGLSASLRAAAAAGAAATSPAARRSSAAIPPEAISPAEGMVADGAPSRAPNSAPSSTPVPEWPVAASVPSPQKDHRRLDETLL